MTYPQVALFDMDGLLLDTEQRFLEIFLRITDGFGLEDPIELYKSCIGTRYDETKRIISPFLPQGIDHDGFYVAWKDEFVASMKRSVPLKPEAGRVLSSLAAQEVPMAVVTSTATELAQAQLERAGFLRYFDFVVGGDRVQNGKPHPEPYEQAARRLDVKPEVCAAFEDTPTGARSASRAGCMTFQVPDMIAAQVDHDENGNPCWQVAETLGEAIQRSGFLAR